MKAITPTANRKCTGWLNTEPDPLRRLNCFFDTIALAWNNRLQLLSRSYGDFQTSYDYDDDYFVVNSVTDPDGVLTEYSYEPRWRLQEQIALNGKQTTAYSYQIEPGGNYVRTELSFEDSSFPPQITTQYLDGFGRPLSTIRENDGALLSNTTYDSYFREAGRFNITTGPSIISYDASPITRKTILTDAVGNVTETLKTGDPDFFSATKVRDPNGHTSTTYANSLGLTAKTLSGEGSATTYHYDDLARLVLIVNPVGEEFSYDYNDIGRVYEKKVPGASAQTIWWDKAFRPAAVKDGNGNIQIFKHDEYNRITDIYLAPAQSSPGAADTALIEGALSSFFSDTLLRNFYTPEHTWIDSTYERVLTASGLAGWKTTVNFGLDDIGRPYYVGETFPTNPLGKIRTTPQYTDAGPIMGQTIQIVSGGQSLSVVYDFEYDDILRPEQTLLTVGGKGPEPISRLEYNSKDLVKTKYLGEELQKVDYYYDAAGKLIAINSPGEMECFGEDVFCTLQAVVSIDNPADTIYSVGCRYLEGIEIDGEYYEFGSIIDLADAEESPHTADSIAAALHHYGLEGTVSQHDSLTPTGVYMVLTIFNTNATTAELVFTDCANTEFTEVLCCEDEPPAGTGQLEPVLSQNPDLFYESITYNGLDITQIEIGSDCASGLMRNNFTYDANHRVTQMINTFFNPDPLVGSYNTNYEYDLAGNILSLHRNGLIQIDGGIPEFGRIDSLWYTYNNERLQSVSDLLDSTTLAQPKGFGPVFSGYTYDGNGNLTGDGGKGLSMHYNLLNLPDSITDQTNNIWLDYTFGGQKIRKELSGGEERFYLGGLEVVDGDFEAFYHPEGRAVWRNDTLRFQYKLTDHLGNTVVLFEDKDLDTQILTEEMTGDTLLLEVLQRNYYYPFGMEMEGLWDSQTGPGMRYLYNGKEFNEDLGLKWYDYGARWYDASIGRWNGVDPLAEKYAGWSPYGYVLDNPISFVDPDGMRVENEYVFDREKGEYVQVGTVGGNEFDIIYEGTIYDDGTVTVNPNSIEVVDVAWVNHETVEWPLILGREPGLLHLASGNPGATNVEGFEDPIFQTLTFGLGGAVSSTDDLIRLGLAKSSRPKFRKGVVDNVWDMAKRKNGKVYDPDTGSEIIWDKSKPRKGQWDMGHKEGKEWWRQIADFFAGRKSKKQLRDEYNDPSNYHPELPKSNRAKNKKNDYENSTLTRCHFCKR
ncbi:MAG: hypothetical protein IPJ00_12915 [Saprospirales bacterium]|nr:hypothetical protein [Saprospirales bacterium]